MDSDRPTEQADKLYEAAQLVLARAGRNSHNTDKFRQELAWGLTDMARAHRRLSTGLRATYILLEKIERRLDHLEQSQRR